MIEYTVRLYAAHDRDLILLMLNGVRLTTLMQKALIAHFHGEYFQFMLPENFDPDKKDDDPKKIYRIKILFDEKEDAKLVEWLEGYKLMYRNMVIKNITRMYLGSVSLCLFNAYAQTGKWQPISQRELGVRCIRMPMVRLAEDENETEIRYQEPDDLITSAKRGSGKSHLTEEEKEEARQRIRNTPIDEILNRPRTKKVAVKPKYTNPALAKAGNGKKKPDQTDRQVRRQTQYQSEAPEIESYQEPVRSRHTERTVQQRQTAQTAPYRETASQYAEPRRQPVYREAPESVYQKNDRYDTRYEDTRRILEQEAETRYAAEEPQYQRQERPAVQESEYIPQSSEELFREQPVQQEYPQQDSNMQSYDNSQEEDYDDEDDFDVASAFEQMRNG